MKRSRLVSPAVSVSIDVPPPVSNPKRRHYRADIKRKPLGDPVPASPPSMIEMLRALVEIPSMSSGDARHERGNQGVVEVLGEWLSDFGFSVAQVPLRGRPAKYNLIARLDEQHFDLRLRRLQGRRVVGTAPRSDSRS